MGWRNYKFLHNENKNNKINENKREKGNLEIFIENFSLDKNKNNPLKTIKAKTYFFDIGKNKELQYVVENNKSKGSKELRNKPNEHYLKIYSKYSREFEEIKTLIQQKTGLKLIEY